MTLNLRKMASLVAIIVALGFISSAVAQKDSKQGKAAKAPKVGQPVIWSDPGAVEKLDFVGGIGGRGNAPKPPFTFIDESMSGSNPKVRVLDANGVKWVAKFGPEVNAETFATRLAWAAGYYVEPDYFLPNGKIEKVGSLTRARKFVRQDGSFTAARFERHHDKGVKKLEDEESWDWMKNPFIGTKELNGLKVIMMLVSNWDNKDVRDVSRGSNTAIYRTKTGLGMEDRYLISDWGGSMGKWGGLITREKWDCNGFHVQTKDFVKGVKGDQVEFGYSGQHTAGFKDGIRVTDVKWVSQYLGRITDDQLRMGLQASGASSQEVACFTQSVRDRINQLLKVAK
ncbi:MAG: hypothetical protein J2P21_07375 [Chloracidobacterium sp.]|nr:hypothetical protein [Chloracidobacterium sp.]